ncbi:hypothetical protein, partial [Erwinia amylovora]|uniref:hypothetical protein n=1 Tax=Erwinia amylovora TaxID=552 RepID=UPI003CFF0004
MATLHYQRKYKNQRSKWQIPSLLMLYGWSDFITRQILMSATAKSGVLSSSILISLIPASCPIRGHVYVMEFRNWEKEKDAWLIDPSLTGAWV